MMHAIHFGAGNIGRGLLGYVLNHNRYHICFVDINKALISKLNQENSYEIQVLDEQDKIERISNVSALDPDFELIAVYNRKTDDKFQISAKNLETYLQAKKNTTVNAAELQQRMRGLSYTKSPSGYIFKKVN